MTEKYSDWTIITNRPDNLCDYIGRKFSFNKYGWLSATIQKEINTDQDVYYLTFCSSAPFTVNDKKMVLRTKTNDYHALIDEANDLIRVLLTQMHDNIMEMINQLPDM